MLIHCPNCETTHQTTDDQIGQHLLCRCGQWLMIVRRRNGTRYAVKVQPPKEREVNE